MEPNPVYKAGRRRRPRKQPPAETHSHNSRFKAAITDILAGALNGDAKYRDDRGYVRWGRVEKDLHATVDAFTAPRRRSKKAKPQ